MPSAIGDRLSGYPEGVRTIEDAASGMACSGVFVFPPADGRRARPNRSGFPAGSGMPVRRPGGCVTRQVP